jgi:hypothetical protein
MVEDNGAMHMTHRLADTLRAALLGFGLLGVGSLALTAANDAVGEARDVRMEAASCPGLVVHRPRQDVAYKAGVDVRGNPVLGADVDDGGFRLDNVTLDLKAPLIPRIPGLGASEIVVGSADVDLLGGSVRLDGQELTAQQFHFTECQGATVPSAR